MRRLRNAINPFSSGFSRWWCRCDLRALLDSKPRGTYKRLIPGRRAPMAPVDADLMRSRAAAIDRLMAEQDARER